MDRDSSQNPSRDIAASSLLEVLERLTAELHPHRTAIKPVTLESSLDRDLGLDSLARVELLTRVERRLNVRIPERKFVEAETPHELLEEIMLAGPSIRPNVAAPPAAVAAGDVDSAPAEASTLVEVLMWHVRAHPDRVHVQFYADEGDGDTLTYGQLHEGAARVAAGLQHRGLRKGDAVAIMLPTGEDYFFSFMGILMAGGTPVPIYPPARKAQIEDHLRRHQSILGNCRATTLITIKEAKPLARILKAHVGSLQDVATVAEVASGAGEVEPQPVAADDLAFLQYTSGSTGNPKGVMLTHNNLLANIRVMSQTAIADDTDVIVSWLPLYHDMGLIGTWMCSMYNAVPFVLMSPIDFITRPERWLWAIHRYKGTLSAAPNFAYELCLKRLDDEILEGLDLSSWRMAFNGAEPVSPSTIDRFCDRFAPYGFRRETLTPVYGLAECSVGLTFPPIGRGQRVDKIRRDPFSRRGEAIPAAEGDDASALQFVGCGMPLRGHEIRIVDPAGVELPERREGRIQFRGPSATKGYFENPEATKKLVHGDWLESGDLGYMVGGEIFVTGRKKDIIIRAGRNIYPSELEEAVGGVPGVRKGNVAVFGAVDESSGTEMLVVLAESRETDPSAHEKIRTDINARAADLIGTPVDDIVLTPPQTVPKTSSGKIRRAASRELYEKGQVGKKPVAMWVQLARMGLRGLLPEIRAGARTAGGLLYAGYVYALVGVLCALAFFPVVLLPKPSWRWWVLKAVSKTASFMQGMRISVEGLENVPRRGDCVLVANHASYVDSYVVPAALPVQVRFVAKVELTRSFFPRLFVSRLGTEFVERFDKQRGIADARRIGRRARNGPPLFFYPEGGTSRVPGLRAFHMGAFAVAAESGLDVVPVAIRGTRSILRSGSWFPRPGRVSVVVGPAVQPPDDEGVADSWTAAVGMRDQARKFILAHCGEPDLAPERISS
ncbi:MAG: AMP-binding protein [Candidatus Latescibacterota bacterium]